MKSVKNRNQGDAHEPERAAQTPGGLDAYKTQGGGLVGTGSGMVASGHPANDVINPHSRLGDSDRVQPQADEHIGESAATGKHAGPVAGTKGSGQPIISGAGQRADDRPGRNEAKTEHAASSLNTHE